MLVTDLRALPVEVDDLDADGFLALAAEVDTKERGAARDKLRLAANWCVRHPATIATGAATWADSGVAEALGCDETIGGEGTPLVAAFAVEPFAASIKTSTGVGMQLMADALNLIHRLPRTWAKVTSLEVPAWRGCRVARLTASLTQQAALYVDQELAGRVGSCGVVTIDRIIAEAVARFDPAALAEREAKARRTWGVRLFHGKNPDGFHGTSWIDATGDTLDLTRFHDYVCQVAEQLRLDGDTDDLDLRKSKALGVIADQAGGGVSAAKTKLYLHLTLADLEADLEAGTGVGTVEKLGPATTTKIRDWANNSRMTIQPVLDMGRGDSVDRHDPPAWMRELVILRDQHCVFPWCQRDARGCDLDHIEPYAPGTKDDPGPPGQTRPANLAPLCRRHHRCKTVGRWKYRRLPDGNYEWRSPHHRTYVVTPTATSILKRTDPQT